MMNRLRCTFSQLQREPHEEMEIFMAFAEGEAAGQRRLQEQQNAQQN